MTPAAAVTVTEHDGPEHDALNPAVWSEDAVAAFAIVPGLIGVTVTETVALDPAVIVPRLQLIDVVPEQLPWLAATEPMIVFAGGASVSTTFVWSTAPVSETCSTKVTGESAV